MDAGEIFGVGAFLTVILLGACAVFGWGMNIYKFAKCDFEAPLKAEIVRGIGIPFAPMGAVVGWFHIDDTPSVSVKAQQLIDDAKKLVE